jgi:hypothetical protein
VLLLLIPTGPETGLNGQGLVPIRCLSDVSLAQLERIFLPLASSDRSLCDNTSSMMPARLITRRVAWFQAYRT